MVETIRIALALAKSRLPVEIRDADDLPRYNRILPFVTWKPLAPLRPFAV